MGLSFKKFVSKFTGTLAKGVSSLAQIAAPFVGAGIGGFLAQQLAPGVEGQGTAAVVRSNLAMRGSCPIPGLAGNRTPSANPITRAAISPGFDLSRIPARPLQALFGGLQRPQFQQTTSFRQQAFGASVGPSFRPFTPSFRSGQLGSTGQFQPGIARGLDFGGFGGFGGF